MPTSMTSAPAAIRPSVSAAMSSGPESRPSRHTANVGALRSGDHEAVKLDIQQVVKVSHEAKAIVKVILETALLDDNQKATACTLAKLAGADFVKTSTGFGPSGATAHDVALMRLVVGPDMGVKASGGVRTLEDLEKDLRSKGFIPLEPKTLSTIAQSQGVPLPPATLPDTPQPVSQQAQGIQEDALGPADVTHRFD